MKANIVVIIAAVFLVTLLSCARPLPQVTPKQRTITSAIVSRIDKRKLSSTPSINSVSPLSGPTNGSAILTLTGTALDGTTQVTYSYSNLFFTSYSYNCTIISVTSTVITCQTSPGVGNGFSISFVVNGSYYQADSSVTWSYDAPTINSVSPNHGSDNGGTFITITGDNFGPNVANTAVYVGETILGSGYACINVTMVVPNQKLTCTTPSGLGSGLTVEAGGQQTTLTNGFQYQTPSSVKRLAGGIVALIVILPLLCICCLIIIITIPILYFLGCLTAITGATIVAAKA
jgi:hypothetical protein